MMKKVVSLSVVAMLFMACGTNTQNGNIEENSQEATSGEVVDGFYGEGIEETGAVAMASFISQMEENDSLAIKVKGTIEKTCKMKGCWMTVQIDEGETMRVSFKDYAFFVPMEGMEGKEVIVEGMAKKQIVSVQELKHFAQDGGATKAELEAITEDSEEMMFEASGVIIKEVETASTPL